MVNVRFFIGNRTDGRKFARSDVKLPAKRYGRSDAFRGFFGFGCKSLCFTSSVLRLSEDLPVIVEIVDSEDKINGFLPFLDPMVKDGLVTLEKANVVMYRA
jgi:PII-like signaling protein